MTEIQTAVLVLLRASLFCIPAEPPLTLTDKQIDEVFSLAFAHSVGGFVYDGTVVSSLNIAPGIREMATGHVLSLVASYQLLKGVLFEILDRFEADNVKTVVYKGFSVALRYCTPELRSMHDIDLFVPGSHFNTASLCLLSLGFEAEKTVSIHHVSFKRGGYIVELHNSLFPFAEIPRLNQAILQADITASEHIRTIMVDGHSVPVFDEYSLVRSVFLHAMKHFLYNGIGLSILCDWAVLLNSCSDGFDWLEFERFVENCGVLEFYKCLNSVCNAALRPGNEGASGPDCFSGIEADFLEDIFTSSKVYDEKRLSEASAVYYKAISLNTGGNIWTPLGKTLRAVGRGTSLKYSYARKYAFLHPLSFVHAYASFFTGTAARAVGTLFAYRSSKSVQRRLGLFKRLKIFQ